MGEGGRLGAQPGGGGGEVRRAGVRLRGVAGLSEGGDGGERGSSGAVRGKTCVPQGLAEAWGLLSGLGRGVLRWWPGRRLRDQDQMKRKRRRRRCWQRVEQAQVGRWSAGPQGW